MAAATEFHAWEAPERQWDYAPVDDWAAQPDDEVALDHHAIARKEAVCFLCETIVDARLATQASAKTECIVAYSAVKVDVVNPTTCAVAMFIPIAGDRTSLA